MFRATSHAQTVSPNTFNLQGVLTSPGGTAVPDGVYSITFRLYTSAIGDVAVWSESQNNISIRSGVFNVILGNLSPFRIPFDQPYFLGIKVGQEPEMTPRVELTSTPYSLMAKRVENNSITTDQIQGNAVTIDKIATPLLSSVNGITNDGGNVNLVAGANVSIASDDVKKTITISATGGVGGTGSITQLTEGNGITIQNPAGPFAAIGLKPNILLGPSGSLALLSQNGTAVASFSANTANQGGSISTSNAQGIQMFGVSNFSDGQPLFYLNNKLGRQIVDIKGNEFSDAEMNLKSSTGNTVIRMTTNEAAGGLVNVFNSSGLITTQITNSIAENGLKAGSGKLVLKSVDNNRVLQLETNTAGGGVLRLYNVEGTEALRLTTFNTYGGSVSVNNRSGTTVGTMNANDGGDGQISLRSALNTRVLFLGTNNNNGGFFDLANQDGNEVVRISTFQDRQPHFRMNNRLFNEVVQLEANEFSDGQLTLKSVLTNPTVRLTANDDAGGLINVFNPNGAIAARLLGDGTGYFGLYNRDNTEMIQMGILSDQNARITVNNRLGNPVADLISNEFSDGQLTLRSVLNKPTVVVGANDNAGGLVNVFSQTGLASRLTEVDGDGDFKIFNKENVDIISLKSFLGSGEILLKNKPGFDLAGIAGSSTGGFMFVADGAKPSGLNLRGVLNGGVGGGELELYNASGIKTFLLTTNFNYEGLLKIISEDKTKSRVELGSDGKETGFLKLFNAKGLPSAELLNDPTSLGGSLRLFNKDTQLIHNLTVKSYGEGLFQIKSKSNNAENVMEMGGTADSEGYMHLFNQSAKAIITLYSAGGDGTIALNNKFGKRAAALDGSQFGGSLSLHNAANNLVHYMSTNQANQEGIYSIRNKTDQEKKRLELGGDNLGNGYLNLFNNKGLNTFFVGHNEFNDGHILLKNNLGNLGTYITAYGDGGSVVVTDGKPGTNHRIAMDAGLNGGKLSIYNKEIKLVGDLSVGDNGEGLWRIPGKQDLTKNRILLGGDNSGSGFQKFYNGAAFRILETGALSDGAGYLATYNKSGKQLTNISPSGNAGGAFTIMNDNENIVGVMAYDGTGGTVYVSNKDRIGGSWLSTNALGGSLFIRNNGGKQNGELITTAAGGDLNLFSSTGANTARLGQFQNGSGILEIGTPNGDKVARVTASDGTGYIGLDNINKLEVVRITANLGKGGGMGLRNEKGFDMIHLTQDQSYGTILVNNATGGVLTNITRNSVNGAFIGTKDQNGKDAVWLSSGAQGGGVMYSFNNLSKTATTINADANNIGNVSVHGSAGNEIARLSGTSNGVGLLRIFNGAGTNLAGVTSNSLSGAGYVYVQNSGGKELARMTTTTDGTTGSISTDNSSGVNLTGMTSSSLGAGYIYANASNGKTVGVITATSNSGGIIAANNPSATSVSYLTNNTLNGGYVGVANSAGNDRARLTTNASGAGHISVGNASGANVVQLGASSSNHGEIATINASGAIINAIGATGTSQGYIATNNSAGQERAFLQGGNFGGEIGVNDASGKNRVIMAGSGLMEVKDVDGSYLSAYSSGSGAHLILVDKFQHARAEVKSGTILAKGPNGVEHSFMSSATAPNLGYIGVCNSNIIGSPVKAGMYTNASNQGVLFADIKNFKIDYPGQPDKQIWYGSLEGPELAAYIRGTGSLVNGKSDIVFSDHYQKLANTGTMTVILTPLSGKSKGLAVVKKSNTGFKVEELLDGSGSYDFDWEVKCVRIGHEGFEVVRNKSDDPKPFISETNFPESLESRSIKVSTKEPIVQEQIVRQQ